LRWAFRSVGDSGFVFVNNYERFAALSAKKDVVLEACGVKFPKMIVPSGMMAIFPVNIDGIRYATAQLVAKREGKIYMMQIPGISTTIALQNGKILKNVKPKGAALPIYNNVYLLTRQETEHLFLHAPETQETLESLVITKIRDAGPLRQIVKGKAKVAEAPSEADWDAAAVYKIELPSQLSSLTSHLLRISYRGDCARLYANGKLIADNFYYGRPFLYGLWRLPKDCKDMELRILPLQPDAPIYLPREADKTPGENVRKVDIIGVE
jgi:hypothetical protein